MKTPIIYGAGMALCGLGISLLSHVLGWTTEPEKLLIGGVVGLLGFLAINITGLVLGTKQVRAERGEAGFRYGAAFAAGFKITFWASLFGVILSLFFFTVIQPDFAEIQREAARHFLERMNMPPGQIELALEKSQANNTLGRQLRGGFIGGMVFGTIISLITGAVMKRAPVEVLDVSAAPPPL